MSRHVNNNSSYAYPGLFVCTGIAAGFLLFWLLTNLFQFRGLDEWTLSTDPVNAIISLLTLFAAFTIIRKLQHQDDTSSKIRDLFAQYLADFRSDYRQTVTSLIKNNSVDAQLAIQRVTRFKKRAKMLTELGIQHGLLTQSTPEVTQLRKAIGKKMLDLLTYTPQVAAAGVVAPVQASAGRIILTERRITEVADQIYETEKLIFTITAITHR